MALRISKKYINPDLAKIIRQHLYLIPEESFYIKNMYGKNNNASSNKEALLFFSTDGDDILLPYAYGKKILNQYQIQHISPVLPITNFTFTGTLNDHQIPLIEDCISQLSQYGTTTLNIFTGSGKTIMAVYLASILKRKTLILFHRDIFISQWFSTLNEFTSAKSWIIKEGNENKPPDEFDIILSMDSRFNKIPIEIKNQIGTVIIDEAHAFCTPSRVPILLGTQPNYVISCTATLKRNDGLEFMIQLICGMHKVMKISRKPFSVHKMNTGIKFPLPLNKQGKPDWTEIVTQLCNNVQRNQYAMDMVLSNHQHKILILTGRKEHVDNIHNYLKLCGQSVDYMAGNKRSYNDSRILVGTISKIGTGFDEKSACQNFSGFRIDMLILMTSIASMELLEQVAGRCFRADFPMIIHLVDDLSMIKRHWKEAEEWYRSRNGTIYEINITPTPPDDGLNANKEQEVLDKYLDSKK